MSHRELRIVAAFLLLLGVGLAVLAASWDEETYGSEAVGCENPTVTIIDEDAYDEVVPGTPTVWGNFSPNRDQGPFDGPPAYPSDPRGTWQMHEGDGGPQQDVTGVFQNGNGHGDWFVRVAGTDDTIIHHDAVTHEEPNPLFPCAPPPPPPPPPPVDCEPACPPPTTVDPPELPDPPCIFKVGSDVLDCDQAFVPVGKFGDPPAPEGELARTGLGNAWLAAIGVALIAMGTALRRYAGRSL